MTPRRRHPDPRRNSWLNPDPLYVEPDPEPVRRPETRPRLDLAFGLVAGLVVLVILAIAAAPRSGQTTDRVDVSPVASAALSGAPLHESAGGAPASPAGEVGEPLTRIRGTATWYCGQGSPCTRGYGPADKVAAIDTDLGFSKGDVVIVRFGERSVAVRIVDVCGCPGERLIDLTTSAFLELAPLGLGVLPVTVELATLPPTEAEP